MLREDAGLEFAVIQCVEIRESVMRGNHCREFSRLLLQQNKNVPENENNFAHTAICGS